MEQPYTVEDAKIIRDASGNVINPQSMIDQLNGYLSMIETLKAQAKMIYLALPTSLSQEFIKAFELNQP